MSLFKKLSVVLLLVANAHAQFGPSVTSTGSSASTAAAPTTSSAPAAAESSTSPTPTESDSVPPPPAESTGCVLHIDHYHCEGPADGHEDHDHSPTNTAEPSIPSPTESSNCIWRELLPSLADCAETSLTVLDISHWDCFDTEAEAEEAQGAEDTGECIIHGMWLAPSLQNTPLTM